jgi:hypothetical protein
MIDTRTNLTLVDIDIELAMEQSKYLAMLAMGNTLSQDKMESVWAFLGVLNDAIFEKVGNDFRHL